MLKIMEKIINNNYFIQRYFDNHKDGLASGKYLSKEDASSLLNKKKNKYLYSYRVCEHLAIVGIVPFNTGKAYVFNIPPDNTNNAHNVYITIGVYENLMNCYVFSGTSISKSKLEELEKEYYKRGGIEFEKYHDFEEVVLEPERRLRQRRYRNDIVEDILKHGFREVGKRKWSNGTVVIKQCSIQSSNVNYGRVKNHVDLNTSIDRIILIGSIFARYYNNVNQLSEDLFCIPCNKKNRQTYHFTCFKILFK